MQRDLLNTKFGEEVPSKSDDLNINVGILDTKNFNTNLIKLTKTTPLRGGGTRTAPTSA